MPKFFSVLDLLITLLLGVKVALEDLSSEFILGLLNLLTDSGLIEALWTKLYCFGEVLPSKSTKLYISSSSFTDFLVS
mgnify:CR=1 FL=1